MLKLLIVAAVCLLQAQLGTCEERLFEGTQFACHRLPLNVRPTNYELHLKFASLESDFYEGHVNITVEFSTYKQVRRAAAERGDRAKSDIIKSMKDADCFFANDPNLIVLHADESLHIDDIKVRSEAHLGCLFSGGMRNRDVGGLLRDGYKQMIAIKLKQGLRPGSRGKISISFRGKMRDDKRGVYLSTFRDRDQIYKHVVSQFQPTFARTAFPCFDEPRFKVPISLKISHPPNLVAYGNTGIKSTVRSDIDSLVTRTFATTPNMPIHMVAFTVGQFDVPIEEVSEYFVNGTKTMRRIRIVTAPGKRHTTFFPLEVAKKSLEWFERYIDFPYPLSKLDIIAIAELDRDNSESLGLVFVRDDLLFVDYETKLDKRIATALNVAHVVVHQWFGNLISPVWWTELWITEGVAAQFAFRLVRELYDFQSELYLRLVTMAEVMQLDQVGSSHALSPPPQALTTSDEIYGLFDELEFMKSGSLAEMTSEAIGDSCYQGTLRRLVASNAHGSINFDDYEGALSRDGERGHPSAIWMMRTFARYVGVPVLNVVDGEYPSTNTQLSLERFDQAHHLVRSVTSNQEQDLGLYTTLNEGGTKSGFYLQTRRYHGISAKFFSPIRKEYELDDRYVQLGSGLNLGAYYRVRYTNELYHRLELAIEANEIEPMGRIQILDDASNLVRAQLISNDTFKSLMDSFAKEKDGAVILQLLAANNTLSKLQTSDDERPTKALDAFMTLFKRYEFESSSFWNETLMLQRAREATFTSMIKQGNQEVTAAALRALQKQGPNLPTFLRQPVYTAIVLTNSSQVEELFYRLDHSKYYEERVRLLEALSLSQDKRVLERTLIWLNFTDLKRQMVLPFLRSISEKLFK